MAKGGSPPEQAILARTEPRLRLQECPPDRRYSGGEGVVCQRSAGEFQRGEACPWPRDP